MMAARSGRTDASPDREGKREGRGEGSAPRAGLAGYLALAALLIVADQATKWLAVSMLDFRERVAVLPGFFDFTLVYNRGAAFSFLAGADGWQRWFFTAVGIGASIFIVWMLARHGSQRLFSFAMSLILAGALGNVIDRLWRGEVVDFVLLHWRDWYFPAFNVADACITVGAVLLILDELRRIRRAR